MADVPKLGLLDLFRAPQRPAAPLPSARDQTVVVPEYYELMQRQLGVPPKKKPARVVMDTYLDHLRWLREHRKEYPNQEFDQEIQAKEDEIKAMLGVPGYEVWSDMWGFEPYYNYYDSEVPSVWDKLRAMSRAYNGLAPSRIGPDPMVPGEQRVFPDIVRAWARPAAPPPTLRGLLK